MRIDTVGIAAAARASLGGGDISVWKVGAIIEAVAGPPTIWMNVRLLTRLPLVVRDPAFDDLRTRQQ